MNHFKITYCFLAILVLFVTRSLGQNTDQNDSLNNKVKNIAREIITEKGTTCSLITLDENNLPMVRVMDPFVPENDFTVWFGTNPKSRKVGQIRQNPNVTLFYVPDDVTGYVVIHGKALLIDDPKEKEKRWKEEWKAFYPNKPADYLLIKVSPEWMEVLNYTQGINGDPVTWQPQKVILGSRK